MHIIIKYIRLNEFVTHTRSIYSWNKGKLNLNTFKKIGLIVLGLGFDPRKLLKSILNLPHYTYGYFYFFLNIKKYPEWKLRLFPILCDRNTHSGVASGHYFHQDLWMAREIFRVKPNNHIDIGSRIDGFIAHLLTFMNVKVIDIRDLNTNVNGLSFLRADITILEPKYIGKSESVSCLHALEHFGLGRYGDKLDIDGWKVGIKNISELVQDDGLLYFSVPIGKQTIEYNAHRVFNHQDVLDRFLDNGLVLKKFALVNDMGDLLIYDEDIKKIDMNELDYGLGLYIYKKTIHITNK